MKIAQIAPLAESVPPRMYGGTERIVSYLTEELVKLGHQVTLFAGGDSITSANLVSYPDDQGLIRLLAKRHGRSVLGLPTAGATEKNSEVSDHQDGGLSPPVAQHTCDSCHQGLPPEQSRPSCIYRAQIENSSDKHPVILPEIAVAFGDLDQIRMCHIPV